MIVIGVGNRFRGDDGVGLKVAESLQKLNPPGVTIVEHSGEGTDLMELWKKEDSVILIDAVHSGKPPGSIHRFDLTTAPLPATIFHHSTHTFGVPEAIELSRVFNELPPHFVIYGIEGKSFSLQSDISNELRDAVSQVEKKILIELQYQNTL